jgi:hypothetical protein
MIDDHKRLLAHYPVLASIPGTELDAALRNARLVRSKAGAVVFEELQSCHAFPFVLSGNIKVVKRSGSGREITLH